VGKWLCLLGASKKFGVDEYIWCRRPEHSFPKYNWLSISIGTPMDSASDGKYLGKNQHKMILPTITFFIWALIKHSKWSSWG
jgi:hypothetical protein